LTACSLSKSQEYGELHFYLPLACQLIDDADAFHNSRMKLYQQIHKVPQISDGFHYFSSFVGC
jgi:hypothetical protein